MEPKSFSPDSNDKMRILNIGCGADTYGTDFIDFYPQRSEVLRCDIDGEKFPYLNESFDKVYAKNVFEHLTNPSNLMQEVSRVLKKGGNFEVITDNASYLGFHLPIGTTYDHAYGCGNEDRHYALFTKSHLRNWMRKFGFEIELLEYLPIKPEGSFKILKRMMLAILPTRYSHTRLRVVTHKLNSDEPKPNGKICHG